MMRKNITVLFLIVFSIVGISAQKKAEIPDKKIKIVLLGTFHFGATNDKNKTGFDDEFSPKRQAEISCIFEQLAKYNPDKIFVEQEPSEQAKWDKIYADYKNGIEPTGNDLKNEIFQIGVKTAKAANNPNGVTCVDYQIPTKTEEALKTAETDVERAYINLVNAIDNAPEPKNTNEKFLFLPFRTSKDFKQYKLAETNLLDYYLWMNSPEYIARNHYNNDNYLGLAIGQKNNYVGAEYVGLWYNRNLKILTNILRTASLEDNRYLLIIGSAHVKVLRDFFAGNPYFEIVEVEDVLGAPIKKGGNLKSIKSVK
ncbi:MAG: DUF5694 domain-containing protein [Acidobacteriota bacterium]|nr:DUF5694 domain-containing protein [Acidobacteriota bacterium]